MTRAEGSLFLVETTDATGRVDPSLQERRGSVLSESMRRGSGLVLAAFLVMGMGSLAMQAELPVLFEDKTLPASAKSLLLEHASKIEAWIEQSPAITDAIKAQNGRNLELTAIQATDQSWIAGDDLGGLPRQLSSGPCTERIQEFLATGNYVEGFAMDQQGALVCMTQRTSDYWQGDEKIWLEAFREGKGAIFIASPKIDESAGTMLCQISVPVMSHEKAIGVVTVGRLVNYFGEGFISGLKDK